MAPPIPRSKFSRVIIAKAREWRDVMSELPLLEEYDSLEDAIRASTTRKEAADSLERATQERVSTLQGQEKELQSKVSTLQDQAVKIEEDNAASAKLAKSAAALEASTMRKEAESRTSTILEEARTKADTIVRDGQVAAEAHRDSLAEEVATLEARVATLKQEEADTSAAHSRATKALAKLREQLGAAA